MEISIKKSTFDLAWNYLKLSEHKLSLLKNQKLASKLQIPELENSETEVSLKQFLKKTDLLLLLLLLLLIYFSLAYDM